MAVGIGIHQQEDLPVAQLRQVHRFADAAAKRADDVLELFVLQ
jgi:hypothetical protein